MAKFTKLKYFVLNNIIYLVHIASKTTASQMAKASAKA